MAWPKVCIPKYGGGLGIRNIVHWNKMAMAGILGHNKKKKITYGLNGK